MTGTHCMRQSDWFIGREKELQYLERLYSNNSFTTCALYGKRQIGKTALLRRFSTGKRNLTFQFSKGVLYENLQHMRQVLSMFLRSDIGPLETLTEAMLRIEEICLGGKTVVVFDEMPFLEDSLPGAASIIQRFIDTNRDRLDTLFIICGSSVAMMRKMTEEYQSPLYGRFPNRLQLLPLTCEECSGFHPKMPPEDALKTYLTVGGIPAYQRNMSGTSFRESMIKCFLGPGAPMRNEADVVLEGEMPNPQVCSGILTCIAGGKNVRAEIADTIGISKPLCNKYVSDMESLGLVSERHPMLSAKKRPYIIEDPLLAFEYTVLRKYRTLLPDENTYSTYSVMKKDIDAFLGRRFEILCRDFVRSRYAVKEIGCWWGRFEGTTTDIDVVAEYYDGNGIELTLLGECKFRKGPMGMETLEGLREKGKSAGAGGNVRYILFSLGGFAPELKEYAEDHDVRLVGTEDLLSAEKA